LDRDAFHNPAVADAHGGDVANFCVPAVKAIGAILPWELTFWTASTSPERLAPQDTLFASWYYGFNRVTFAGLHVRFDDKELWTAPRPTRTSSTNSYHLVPVPLRR
jgi:hypothetical protein